MQPDNPLDKPGLTIAYGHAELARRAINAILERGVVVPDRDGALRKNRDVAVFLEHSAAFRAWAKEMALTPKARAEL